MKASFLCSDWLSFNLSFPPVALWHGSECFGEGLRWSDHRTDKRVDNWVEKVAMNAVLLPLPVMLPEEHSQSSFDIAAGKLLNRTLQQVMADKQ